LKTKKPEYLLEYQKVLDIRIKKAVSTTFRTFHPMIFKKFLLHQILMNDMVYAIWLCLH
jgi:hypothetical protein